MYLKGRPHFDLRGQRSGMLVPVEYVPGPYKNRNGWWRCICDCGQISYAPTSDLRKGKRTSCGCANLTVSPYRDLVVEAFRRSGGSRASIARELGISKNTVVGILYRSTSKQRRLRYVQPCFEDDPRATRPDRGRIGLPPATEVGTAATPLIEAIRGRWSPQRGVTSAR